MESVLSANRHKEWLRDKPAAADAAPVFRCIVQADLLRRASTCVGNFETRYYLSAVQIERHPDGGVLLVATDGHRLIAIRDKRGFIENGPAIVRIRKETFAGIYLAQKAAPKTPLANIMIVVEGQRAGIMHLGSDYKPEPAFESLRALACFMHAFQWSGTLIDGKFPDWRKVIPRRLAETAPPAQFDQRLLGGLVNALSGAESTAAFRLTPSDAHSPMSPHLVRTSCKSIDGFGIIMPMRNDAPAEYPQWPKFFEPLLSAPEPPAHAAPAPVTRWTRFLGIPMRLIGDAQ